MDLNEIGKGDYAILYAVTEEQWPAWLLLNEETMSGINRFFPGLHPRELTEHFFRLWSKGLIECAEGEDEPAIAPDYELALQQFEFDHSLSDRPQTNSLTYRLTAAGGEVWEHFAATDWTRFFNTGCGSSTKEWTLTAPTRRPIEICLRLPKIAPRPIAGTERWEVLEPWRATYWKKLLIGHRLSYTYENWPRLELRDEEEITAWGKAWQEFAPYWGQWHKGFEQVCAEHFTTK